MTRRQLCLLWAFIVVVAVFDAGFALVHRKDFLEWEQNPLAVFVAGHCGLSWLIALRLSSVLSGLWYATTTSCARWFTAGTVVASLLHLYLLCLYLLYLLIFLDEQAALLDRY